MERSDPCIEAQIAAFHQKAFALLLKGFAQVNARAVSIRKTAAGSFEKLLSEFSAANRRTESVDRDMAAVAVKSFENTLSEFSLELNRWQAREALTAERFNLLNVLGVSGDEVRHSSLLAWMVARDSKRGTHGQGALGFEQLLKVLGLPLEYALEPYWVRCEESGDESRVDIEVAARGRFLIHIEVKIWASEGWVQTEREWRDLNRKAAALGIRTEMQNAPVHAIFLTVDGSSASHTGFRNVSWRRVAKAFELFADAAQPTDVKLFSRHCAKALCGLVGSAALGER